MAYVESGHRPRAINPRTVRPGQPGLGWLRPTARQAPGDVRESRELAIALMR